MRTTKTNKQTTNDKKAIDIQSREDERSRAAWPKRNKLEYVYNARQRCVYIDSNNNTEGESGEAEKTIQQNKKKKKTKETDSLHHIIIFLLFIYSFC